MQERQILEKKANKLTWGARGFTILAVICLFAGVSMVVGTGIATVNWLGDSGGVTASEAAEKYGLNFVASLQWFLFAWLSQRLSTALTVTRELAERTCHPVSDD